MEMCAIENRTSELSPASIARLNCLQLLAASIEVLGAHVSLRISYRSKKPITDKHPMLSLSKFTDEAFLRKCSLYSPESKYMTRFFFFWETFSRHRILLHSRAQLPLPRVFRDHSKNRSFHLLERRNAICMSQIAAPRDHGRLTGNRILRVRQACFCDVHPLLDHLYDVCCGIP